MYMMPLRDNESEAALRAPHLRHPTQLSLSLAPARHTSVEVRSYLGVDAEGRLCILVVVVEGDPRSGLPPEHGNTREARSAGNELLFSFVVVSCCSPWLCVRSCLCASAWWVYGRVRKCGECVVPGRIDQPRVLVLREAIRKRANKKGDACACVAVFCSKRKWRRV